MTVNDALLDAATTAITTGQWRTTTYRTLAAATGLAVSTVYCRYPSLDAMPVAIVNRAIGHYRTRLNRTGMPGMLVEQLIRTDPVAVIGIVTALEAMDVPCGYAPTAAGQAVVAS